MNSIYNIMLLLSIIFSIRLHAQVDFDTYAATFFTNTIDRQPSKSSISQWFKELCSFGNAQLASLVFTAPDMNKNGENPDTSFNNVYTTKNMSIQAWKILPSNKPQQEISLLWGVPDDYDTTQSSTITLYLLAQGKENTGTANIEIAIDSKTTNQLLGPDFVTTVTTGNFLVPEPTEAKDVELLVAQATIPASTIAPKSLLVFIFSRIAPTENKDEYQKNIYLESVVISYTKNDI